MNGLDKKALKAKFLELNEEVQKIFRDYLGFIITLFLLNFITMAWSLMNEDKIEVLFCYGFSLFFAVFLVAALIKMVCRKTWLKETVKGFILFISSIVFGIEFFTMYNYHTLIGTGIINSLFETNFREALEFLNMYVGATEIGSVAAFLAFFYFIRKRRLIDGVRSQPHFNKFVIGIFIVGLFYMIRMIYCYGEFFVDNQFLPFQRAYASAKVALKNIEAYDDLAGKMNADIQLTENKSKIKNVVFILGESTNRNHMGAYGYYLPNTPNIQRMRDAHELELFTDVISPHSTTIAVLSKLFTFCDFESDKEWYQYNNLIDIAKAAGYKTFWLSNQESSGIWGNVAQIFSQHSDKHEFTRIRESREDYGIVDGELLPLIDRALMETEEKNFFVIHLMGTHGLYYNRFPYAFSKFSKDDIKLDVNDEKKTIISQYDNAVYYNDFIVNEIINKFRDKETVIVYVSDHGEAVYDEQNFTGHIEENPNRHMIEVPMLIWTSEQFKKQYPEKVQHIVNSTDNPYMTDDMIHTFLDIMDIKTPDYEPNRSIINEKFDITRKRIFNERDYDCEIKNGVAVESDVIQNKN